MSLPNTSEMSCTSGSLSRRARSDCSRRALYSNVTSRAPWNDTTVITTTIANITPGRDNSRRMCRPSRCATGSAWRLMPTM